MKTIAVDTHGLDRWAWFGRVHAHGGDGSDENPASSCGTKELKAIATTCHGGRRVPTLVDSWRSPGAQCRGGGCASEEEQGAREDG